MTGSDPIRSIHPAVPVYFRGHQELVRGEGEDPCARGAEDARFAAVLASARNELPEGTIVDMAHARTKSGSYYSGPFLVRGHREPNIPERGLGANLVLLGDIHTSNFTLLLCADTEVRVRIVGVE